MVCVKINRQINRSEKPPFVLSGQDISTPFSQFYESTRESLSSLARSLTIKRHDPDSQTQHHSGSVEPDILNRFADLRANLSQEHGLDRKAVEQASVA